VCKPINKASGPWATDDGSCSTDPKDKPLEDADAINHRMDDAIGNDSAEGAAWHDSEYTKDASKSQVIGDAEAAAGDAEDKKTADAVKAGRAEGYTGPSFGVDHHDELLQ